MKHIGSEFVIISIYVDDINIFGTHTLTTQITEKLKTIFEMKDLGKPNFCLGLQINYLPDGILIHQSTYTTKITKQVNMHHARPTSTLMDLRSLDPDKDMFKKKLETEPILSSEIPYL